MHILNISNVLKISIIKNYKINSEILSFQFLYVIFFALISGYVFSREFTDKTAFILYSYPLNRTKIFIGKLLTVYIIIFLVYLAQFAATYLTLYIVFENFFTQNFFITDIKVNVYSMLGQFLLVPMPVLIGSMTKNVILPTVYGVLGAISSMFVMMSGIYMQMSPFMLPALSIYHFYMGDPIDFVLVPLNSALTFGISILLCVYNYKNADID